MLDDARKKLAQLEPHVKALYKGKEPATLTAVVQGLDLSLQAAAQELKVERKVSGGFPQLIAGLHKQGRLTLDQSRIAMADSNLTMAKAVADHPDIFDRSPRLWQDASDAARACFDMLKQLVADHP